MTEPAAALDVLIQRLPTVPLARHSYDCASMRSVDAACNCGWAEDRALTRLAADTLAAQAATLGEKDCQIGALKQVLAEVTAERDEAIRYHRTAAEFLDAHAALLLDRDAQVRAAREQAFNTGYFQGRDDLRVGLSMIEERRAAFCARAAEPKET